MTEPTDAQALAERLAEIAWQHTATASSGVAWRIDLAEKFQADAGLRDLVAERDRLASSDLAAENADLRHEIADTNLARLAMKRERDAALDALREIVHTIDSPHGESTQELVDHIAKIALGAADAVLEGE